MKPWQQLGFHSEREYLKWKKEQDRIVGRKKRLVFFLLIVGFILLTVMIVKTYGSG